MDAPEYNVNPNDTFEFNKAMANVGKSDPKEYNAIFVGHPYEKNGAIFYKVKAYDAQGQFDGDRRYNDFFKLREAFL